MTQSDASTPLIAQHEASGATLSPFAGYRMPIHYGSIVKEHHACRTAAALFDVSHMGRIRFEGPGTEQLLDHLLTRRVGNMSVGDVRYSLICNADGGVLDDVLVYYIEKPSGGRFHLMVVNASNHQKILDWITPQLADFPEVVCTDRTELTAMIALQGPLAMQIASGLFKFDPGRLKYYQGCVTEQFQKPVIISRTGYTGEDGIELITRAEEAPRIWENLLLAGREQGVVPAGLGARDTLRLEAGMPLYGHELNEQTDPISAGLGFACSLKDRTFIGSEALNRIKAQGATQVRIGIQPEGVRPAREGCSILDEHGSPIGHVTSGTVSPTLGHPIAMGYVHAQHASVGNRVGIDIRGRVVSATVIPLPFYKRA